MIVYIYICKIERTSNSDGLQPKRNGLHPTSDGLQPKIERNNVQQYRPEALYLHLHSRLE